MHTSNHDVQALKRPAPQNDSNGFVARTMSSREIAELTGKRHPDVKRDIQIMAKDLQEDVSSFAHIYFDAMNREQTEYLLDRQHTDCLLTGYSAAMRMVVIKRWHELESQVAQPRELSRMDLIQLAFEAEQARLQLTIQVDAQATKIECLENLFKEGMTATQFCKGLNGVNVMQIGQYLEGRSWFYNESKSGTRWRVGSYARDKYMTEHQQEITPHGKDSFISFTPVLLRKGAVRLYELYLAGKLPMKKTWDGLHTHDKASKGAA
jgi:phage regulator Rha-like protein